MLVVAVARVGAWNVGDGVGMLCLVLTAPVVGIAGWSGAGAGMLWLALTVHVVGVAVVGGGGLTWIFSNPHRSNPVSSATLDTDSVGLLR